MTAIAQRRKRRTIVAAVLAAVLSLGAAVMLAVGVVTLANSKEGEAVGIDERPRVEFPSTPNAVLAVTDDDGELASVIVLTLLPEGQGGSIVTIPVNADATAGFGLQRRPLAAMFDADDPLSIVTPIEEMLSITVQRALVVDPAGLAALLEPIESVQVVLPRDVIDTSLIESRRSDDGIVFAAGPQTLDPDEVADVLTAVDDADVDAYDAHETDVALWLALSRSAPITTPPQAVPVDDAGRPVPPADVEELVERLWQGEIGVRDIALVTLVAADNPTDADVVLLDRRDSNLVFAQISPALVSTPNTGLKVRVVANYTPEQLAQSDDLYETTSDLLRVFTGQMLFVQNNVVSADDGPTGAPDITIIEVSNEQFLEATERAAEALFGDAEVRSAKTVLEGVDIEVTLGMSYLNRETARADSGDELAPSSDSTTPADTTTPTSTEADTVGADG